MLYLVDGYNMIGAWPEFRGLTDISQSRELLISMLADFAGFTGDELMLVFDGYKGDKPKTSVERPGTSKGCHWAAKGGKAECRKASRRNDMRK